jgi:hypothetical protein
VARDDGGAAERALVFVDGRPVGHVDEDGRVEQPLLLSNEVLVDAGSRTFTVKYAGCEDGAATLKVAEGSTADVRLLLSCQAKLSMPLVATGLGVAAAGIGLGIGAMVRSNESSGEANGAWNELFLRDGQGACHLSVNRMRCTELEEADNDAAVFEGVAIGGFAVGASATIATFAYLLVRNAGSASPDVNPQGLSVQAAFRVSPDGYGAMIRGAF